MSNIKDASNEELIAELKNRDAWDDVFEAITNSQIKEQFYERGIEYDCNCEDCEECEELPVDDREINDAYLAMRGDTPEPIRHLILSCAGRIA